MAEDQPTARDIAYWAKPSAQQVIAAWKQHFPSFWPEGSRFYAPLYGIAPGEVAVVNATLPGKVRLSTGVFVLYADDESFTFMTRRGTGSPTGLPSARSSGKTRRSRRRRF